jgi:hypothetical protein
MTANLNGSRWLKDLLQRRRLLPCLSLTVCKCLGVWVSMCVWTEFVSARFLTGNKIITNTLNEFVTKTEICCKITKTAIALESDS